MESMVSETMTSSAKAPSSVALCRDALADSSLFVEHIANTLVSCVLHLRVGEDQAAMNNLAKGTGDLAGFLQLIDQMIEIVQPRPDEACTLFKSSLSTCITDLEQTLVAQDLVALADKIEHQLLPIFLQWDGVAQELSTSIDAAA